MDSTHNTPYNPNHTRPLHLASTRGPSPVMQFKIKGYTFEISTPYSEGHQLTPGEAQAFNNLRTENIQNNFRSFVNEQIKRLSPGELLPDSVLQALQAQLTQYDQEYTFAQKSTRTRLGDIEREARAIALERVRVELQQASQSDPTFDPMAWDEQKTSDLVARYALLPAVIEEARARVAAHRSALAGGMEDL